jgi:hypothetical protein
MRSSRRGLFRLPFVALASILVFASACESDAQVDSPRTSSVQVEVSQQGGVYEATEGIQPGLAARTPQKPQSLPEVKIERVTSVVPWPRGIAWVDGKLAVVARGRHRNYGGPAAEVQDRESTIFEIDPNIREPYVAGQLPSDRVANNGRVLAEPDPAVVPLYDRSIAPLDNWLMSRPFCTMVFDQPSRNLIFCGYSGVDLSGKDGGPSFRKNATDALVRFDLRTKRWGLVEMHRANSVPRAEQGAWISNVYYPHHDPARNQPPHGFLNGPNGCAVVGDWLYAVGKDNHTLARYDLRPIRRNPSAGPPPAEVVLTETIDVRIDGKVRPIRMQGHSAVTSHGKWLYVASRTSSIVIRFPIDARGNPVRPIVAELIAEFEPYSTEKKRSADLWEMIASDDGELFLTTSREGMLWRLRPDPSVPFDGNSARKESPTPNRPWIDIKAVTGNKRAGISNITFGPDGSLYFCMTMPEEGRELAGAVMRASTTGL